MPCSLRVTETFQSCGAAGNGVKCGKNLGRCPKLSGDKEQCLNTGYFVAKFGLHIGLRLGD
jgi:hypothetical protein